MEFTLSVPDAFKYIDTDFRNVMPLFVIVAKYVRGESTPLTEKRKKIIQDSRRFQELRRQYMALGIYGIASLLCTEHEGEKKLWRGMTKRFLMQYALRSHKAFQVFAWERQIAAVLIDNNLFPHPFIFCIVDINSR